MSRLSCLAIVFACLVAIPLARGDDPPAAEGTKYDLKYKFRVGEVLRWEVDHRAKIRTTVSGTSQTAETESKSVKVWKIQKVGETTGNVEFLHSVESIIMKQRLSGRQEETYDSTKDKEPPAAFADVAKSVGVPLSHVRIEPRGRVIDRINYNQQAGGTDSQMTVPLPDEPVAIGHSWAVPHEVEIALENKSVKKIQTRQQFKLEDVKNGVAVIHTETVVLTPIHDPAIEVKLIQLQTTGTVRFDIDRGCVIGQQLDLDKQVFGFRGESSTMHYQTRFTETILPEGEVATRPKIGPEPPPGMKLRR